MMCIIELMCNTVMDWLCRCYLVGCHGKSALITCHMCLKDPPLFFFFLPVFRKPLTCCWIMKIKYPWVHLTALCLLIKTTQTLFTGVSRCFILSCSAGGQSGWRAERQTWAVACGKQQLQQTVVFSLGNVMLQPRTWVKIGNKCLNGIFYKP